MTHDVTQNLQRSFDQVNNDGGHVNYPQTQNLQRNNNVCLLTVSEWPEYNK